MKFKQLLLSGLAILAFALPALAQLDTFNIPRTLQLAPPQNFSVATTLNITNGPIDTVLLEGQAVVDVIVCTNSGATGGTLTAQLFQSDDRTNYTAMTGITLINSTTTFVYTNYLFNGVNLTNNNLAYLPGTVTTPTVYSAGYSTPYLAPLPATNAGAITVGPAGHYKMGFAIGHTKRYVAIVWNPMGGTVTNFTAESTLTAIPINSSLE